MNNLIEMSRVHENYRWMMLGVSKHLEWQEEYIAKGSGGGGGGDDESVVRNDKVD